MSYEAFKPRVVWSDTGERFRIVQKREDRGEKADDGGTREFPSAALYVLEETTRRDAMGVSIWAEVCTIDDRPFLYAVAREWLRVDRVLAQVQASRELAEKEVDRLKKELGR